MAFMSPAEVKAVRLRGSKPIIIEGLNKEARIIKMGADAQNRSAELQAEIAAGKRPRNDSILFMFENALAEPDGTPLTADDAVQLFKLLDLPELTKLVNDIAAHMGASVKVTQGAPAVELTPAEKKD